MPVIPAKQKTIRSEEDVRQLQGNCPKYRHLVFDGFNNRGNDSLLTVAMIRPVAAEIVQHVETMEIHCYNIAAELLLYLLSDCVCSSPRAARLKRLKIFGGSLGRAQLGALVKSPSLEELSLDFVVFTCPESVEEFFVSINTLKTLHLVAFANRIKRKEDEEKEAAEVARAFRRGLSRNQTLTKISFRFDRDGPFLQEYLLGVAENPHVQELALYLNSTHPETLLALRGLVAGTTSIRRLRFQRVDYSDVSSYVEIFRGLASNTSIQEIDINVDTLYPPPPFANEALVKGDAQLACAIQECFVANKTLLVRKVRGNLCPRSRVALADGLSQSESIKAFCANGLSTNVLRHVARMHSVSLDGLEGLQNPDWAYEGRNPEWMFLSSSIHNEPAERKLQVLDLSDNHRIQRELGGILAILARFSQIYELSLRDCYIDFRSVPLLCHFIRNAGRLKKLNLGFNRMTTRGAANVLQAVSTSMSMEQLDISGPKEVPDDAVDDPDDDVVDEGARISINDCYDSVQALLLTAGSRLVVLDLTHCEPLGLDAIRSISVGLRENTTVKSIKLPWLELAFIHVLGEALTVNHSLESLEVNSVGVTQDVDGGRILKVLATVEEEAIISFVGMLPRMKSLVSIKHLFDFKPSERFSHALVAALKDNTVLTEIHRDGGLLLVQKVDVDHVCNNERVQFYLELNRLGRHHHSVASESKPTIPVAVLPYFLARMTKAEYSSHLYYFLHCTSPDHLVEQASTSLKRPATASPR